MNKLEYRTFNQQFPLFNKHASLPTVCTFNLLRSFAAKIFHLTAATCQDAPSFGRGPCSYTCTFCPMFVRLKNIVVCQSLRFMI